MRRFYDSAAETLLFHVKLYLPFYWKRRRSASVLRRLPYCRSVTAAKVRSAYCMYVPSAAAPLPGC